MRLSVSVVVWILRVQNAEIPCYNVYRCIVSVACTVASSSSPTIPWKAATERRRHHHPTGPNVDHTRPSGWNLEAAEQIDPMI